MLRGPSFALRIVRSLTALITVWCLGCSSYEPMLSAFLGSGAAATMACDGSGGMDDTSPVVLSAPADSTKGPQVSPPSEGAQCMIACSCQSCQSASPNPLGVASIRLSPPSLPLSSFMSFASVVREPLVPPPEAVD
jgi:hypothetical protein